MGNYITTSTVRGALDTNDGDFSDDGIISSLSKSGDIALQDQMLNAYIDRAEGIVDGYSANSYVTPMPTSGVLEHISLDITILELFKRGMSGEVPEKYRKNAEMSLAMLKDIAEGNLRPPGAIPIGDGDGSSISFSSNDSLLLDEDMNFLI